MTAIRHSLQKGLFQPEGERLVSVINVMKQGAKKKKICFLCLTVTTQNPVAVRLYQVKNEKADVYKKHRSWLLREIRLVDGINLRKQIGDFELTIDKVYKWVAANVGEKDPFIKALWKLCARYLPAQKPEFINVSLPVDEFEIASLSTLSGVGGEVVSQPEEETEEYQPISVKEEADFRRLLGRCQMTIGDAEKFADQLTKELSMLDGANIQAIMGSEAKIEELMSTMDNALEESSEIEEHLDSLDELLTHVRESVEMMEDRGNVVQVQSSNRSKFMEDLNQFLHMMDFSEESQKILIDGSLSEPTGINRCTRAAQQLHKATQTKVSPGMERMKAYSDQMKLFVTITENFSEKLVAHLTTLFQNLVDLSEGGSQWHALGLPKHSQRHHALMPYAELVMWLKQAKADGYKALVDRYIAYTKELYMRQLYQFFEAVKAELRVNTFDRRGSLKLSKGADLQSLAKSPSTLSRGSVGSGHSGSDSGLSDREKFQKLIETLLSELEPVVLAEQKFSVRFFHISSEILLASETQSSGSGDSGGPGVPEKRLEKQFNEQVRFILGQLFKPLDQLLMDFVNHCDRTNPAYVMISLAKLSKHVLSVQDTGSYIAVILGTVVVIVKRKFDTFMESQITRLQGQKLSKRTRLGILDSVSRFEELGEEAEAGFKSAARRGDVDRWYPQLLTAVWEGIERMADDPYSKVPGAVVRMENYHKLHDVLSQLRISCLDSMRKQTKQRYQDNLESYVKEYMGKPLEKLQAFFDQVQICIDQGMRPEEVGYQQAFSKQELKKLVAQYTGKDVKKGLEHLYQKVEKHLKGENSNLLQVVWHGMQDEFLQQHKNYTTLMGQCYPNSNIQLEFTLQDLLHYFSEIALQH